MEDIWQKILNKHIFSGKVLHMVFYKVKEFVAKYNNCDKPNIIMKKMRACLNKENCGREVREYRARLSLYLVSEDVDRIASAMDSTYENMILLRWINSGLDSDVDEKINFWLNTKFKQYHSYDTIDTLDWEKYHNDSKLVLVDHELFTSTVKDLLEKSGIVVVPGDAFGKCGQGYFRISFVCSDEKLQEVIDRMKSDGFKY